MVSIFRVAGLVVVIASAAAAPAWGQTAPTIDTEDASLGSADVGPGRAHPMLSIDVRNGDFARGAYDGDAANFDRVPLHLQVGAAFELHRGADDKPDAWIVVSSSNGRHAPISTEVLTPRSWYESNNLAGVVVSPAPGLKAGLVYTIKTSPNAGPSETTHEASATLSYESKSGFGALHPGVVATFKPRGGQGGFAQVGIEPEMDLASGEDAPTISLPAKFGVGWGGFYQPGTGHGVYGAAGLAYSHPFSLGELKCSFRAEALAVARDRTLRRLSTDDGERSTVVPLATVTLSFAY